MIELKCSSIGSQYTTCAAGGLVHAVTVKQQLSSSTCKMDETFGFSDTDVWVDGGCRARFNIKLHGMMALNHIKFPKVST